MKNTSHINPLENEAIYIFREVVRSLKIQSYYFLEEKIPSL